MSNRHALEAEVVRTVRQAASRSSWSRVLMLPSLFRISQNLENVVRAMETSEVQIEPSDLNRLARKLHCLQGAFTSPFFQIVLSRIERCNLRLASMAEGAYLATERARARRFGPAREGVAMLDTLLRSA